ncbi:hypothetical protein QBC40DRAFT_287473 [Triangularia verruculosa]|uniref:FAD-binding domain-containing protein n=1 Tax=Triangularia verruculosa TaxID=2587418 RepID=A0AAN6XB37_9PEZI|nr:hypothetical protein QBC40DRAFT_287473 [Triangularia verruculosa]
MAVTNHFLEGKKIIVVGGGIAGCTFVAALHKLWNPDLALPNIIVLERNPRDARHHNYSISLHGDSANGGLVALRQLGLLDETLRHSIFGLRSGQFKMWDSNWNELMSTQPQPWGNLPTGSMRIQRRNLERILVGEAERQNAAFHWGVECTGTERLDNGKIRVAVEDETGAKDSHECDFLVVADGAQSNLRAALRPHDDLRYAGAVQIGGKAEFPHGIPKPIEDNWGLMLSGKGVCCYFSAVDKGTVVWALSQQRPEPDTRTSMSTPDRFVTLKEEALRLGNMFSEPFRTIVESTNPSSAFVTAAMEKEPFRHDDPNLERTVFIGDANHAVSPFAGNGANLALKDGWDLAENICYQSSLDNAVAAYDNLGFARAAEAIKSSHQKIDFAHCTSVKDSLLRAGLATGRWFMWMRGM